jgi:hypothetical protein
MKIYLSDIFKLCPKNIGNSRFMPEHIFTLCANTSCKLLIPHEPHFHFMPEPTMRVCGVSSGINPELSGIMRENFGHKP